MNFTRILSIWYDKNKRDLPWRRTKDPYKIWVSEIILQQTRIEQGLAYYLRFIKRFPGIHELAIAREEEVLKLWQGLGYYSRARNMHVAAIDILRRHQGIFPDTYEEIRKLKGIGDYTAAAISSIAFGIPSPVVDGNVLRFFSRYFGIVEPIDSLKGKREVMEKAREFIPLISPGDFNQAIMEFGALQCKPVPDCGTCPMKKGCFAFQQDRVAELPVKSKKQEQRIRCFHYMVILSGSPKNRTIILKKRDQNDIWKNLYDFPLIETGKATSYKKLILLEEWNEIFNGRKVSFLKESKSYRHILSHQVIVAKFYQVKISSESGLHFKKIFLKDLPKYPVPRLIEKYLEEEFFFTT